MEKQIGHYSFIIGVLIALVLGIFATYLGPSATLWLTSLLVVLGLIVGFLNVPAKQIKDFLMYIAVLLIAAGFGGAAANLSSVLFLGPYLAGIYAALLAFVVPATIVVTLKGILEIAKVK